MELTNICMRYIQPEELHLQKCNTFLPIKEILSVAGWKNAHTFNQFYGREVELTTSYADAVLSLAQ